MMRNRRYIPLSTCIISLAIVLGARAEANTTLSRSQIYSAPAVQTSGPYHIATWAWDFWSGRGANASGANVRLLATYAIGDGKALRDCHNPRGSCKAVFYFDSGHEMKPASGCMYSPDAAIVQSASESWFVHDTGYHDSAHRVHGMFSSGCTSNEMNPNSLGLQNWFRAYLQTYADAYDAYFGDGQPMDVADSGWFPSHGGCNPWPSICKSTQEIPNDAAEVAARVNFVNAMNHKNGSPMYTFYQQANLNNNALDVAALTSTSRFSGVTCEGCVAGFTSGVNPARFAPVLDEMAAVNATPGSFVLISQGTFPTGSTNQIVQRLVTTGIAWLGYSEGHTIVWPDLENSSNGLSIWPENLIYPATPVQSMVRGSTDLEVAPGVYRREFANCYQQGVLFGHCAAIVNANASAVYIKGSWLHKTYLHVITLKGGDVLSGGIANRSGASFKPGVTWVGAGSALMLAP